jgi:hypothetical protein
MRAVSLAVLIALSTQCQAQFSETNKNIKTPQGCIAVAGSYLVRTKALNINGQEDNAEVPTLASSLVGSYGGNVEYIYNSDFSSYQGFSISGLSLSSAQSMLSTEDQVLGIEQVCLVQSQVEISDTPAITNWALDRLDQQELPLDGVFDTPSYTEHQTHIYLISQAIRGYLPGTDRLHNELAAVKAPEGLAGNHRDFRSQINNPNSVACTREGNAIAGTIAGASTGIARNSILHSYATLDCGVPAQANTSDVMMAYQAIIDHHNTHFSNEDAVILLGADTLASSGIITAIRDLANQGIPTVLPIGNQNNDDCLVDVRELPEVLAVGASGSSGLNGGIPTFIDDRWHNSSSGECVDIYAPGSSVPIPATSSGNITRGTGTFFSAGYVAGTIAVYLEQNPGASVAQSFAAITNNANKDRVRVLLDENIEDQTDESNDLLNICFLNGSCDPINPEPASITSASTDTACGDDFGIRLFGSNLTQNHRIGVNFNPFTPAARVPSGQIVSNTQGTISWCIPHTTQVDQQLRWDMSTVGIDVYLSNPTGTVIDGPVTVFRARPNSGAIEAPARIEYPTSANGGPDIQITRSTDTRVTRYEYFAANSSSVTPNDSLLASYSISPNNVSSYLFIFELDGEPGPFNPGPSGSNDRLPSGTWYLGVRACDNANNCSPITVGSHSITQ